MSNAVLAKYLTPWKFKRAQEREQRIAELRQRDGDDCRRCRRPLRFDLTPGHDRGPKIERVAAIIPGEPEPDGNQFLCHGRCNADGDHTQEVTERVRRKAEAELLSRPRKRA